MTQNEGGSSITWTEATSGTIDWSEVAEWILAYGVWNDDGVWVDSAQWHDSPIYNDIAAGDRSVT